MRSSHHPRCTFQAERAPSAPKTSQATIKKGGACTPPFHNRENSVSPVAVDQILSSARRAADQGLVRASLIHSIDVGRRVGGVVAAEKDQTFIRHCRKTIGAGFGRERSQSRSVKVDA